MAPLYARPLLGAAWRAAAAWRFTRSGSARLPVKLYVCWGTFPVPWPRRSASWRPGAHPCKKAHDALKAAGHSPDVVKAYGFVALPAITRARKEVKGLTGESFVPVLVLDDGQVISDSRNIVAWARDNPADGAR
jgi:hypothetical protein